MATYSIWPPDSDKLRELKIPAADVQLYYVRPGQERVKGKGYCPQRPKYGVVAVCLIRIDAPKRVNSIPADGGSIYARGIAICSPKDNFARVTGRSLAFERAISALEKGWDQRFGQSGMDRHQTSWLKHDEKTFTFVAYSEFNALLTAHERSLYRVKANRPEEASK